MLTFSQLKFSPQKLTFRLLALLILLSACVADSNDDSSDNGGNGDNGGNDDGTNVKFASECGTLVNGIVKNPVSISNKVNFVSVADSNAIIVSVPLGNILVKLQGIDSARSDQRNSSISTLNSLVTSELYFQEASPNCTTTVDGGGIAIVGQLFTSSGKSISEELLKSGLSINVDSSSACGEDQISGCYQVIKEANEIKSAGEITDFLWKPRADSVFNPGKPVIHVDACDATVFVRGQALTDYGPGNGRCNTSRMFSDCSTYGTNIRVEVKDNSTGLPYLHNGQPFVTVPSGCSRFEFKK